MKVKLLKKLRKRYQIQVRNGKYKVFDNVECLGGVYNQTSWITLQEAYKIRRIWILADAHRYSKPKKII